ncbi:MAG: hypothetical protein EOL87_02240 [Spartobacteria bacterium]|nr:hypothetical protein [Spartobacteria bacterium]
MNLVIGVDIGTQGTKAVLVDIAKGIMASAHTSYSPETPAPSWAQQWPDVWQNATEKVIKEVVTKSGIEPSDVKGLCISSLYGGSGIPVDEQIQPLYPCLIWMDRRAVDQVRWVEENIDSNELFDITGNTVDSYYGYTKIMWIRDNQPDVWNKTKYLLPPNCYVIYQLTGDIAVDYSSAGNIGGIFDIRTREWSIPMMEKLGIPADKMPQRLVASTDVVGQITADAAKRTGLAEGTPVIAGGVDAAVATMTAGVFKPGAHVAMVGTSMCWGFISEENRLSPGLISMPYVLNPEKYTYTFGGAITAGAVVSWFEKNLGRMETEAGKLCDIPAVVLLDKKAEKIPAGSQGLLTLPYMMGERSPIWDPAACGMLIGLNLVHTKAHMYRSFLEGVAMALRHNMDEVLGKIPLDSTLLLVGGAAKSALWTQIFSDVTGFPISIIKEQVEAPLGDALLAAVGIGLVDDPEVMRSWFTIEEVAQPQDAAHTVYNTLYSVYKDMYKNNREAMHTLGSINKG